MCSAMLVVIYEYKKRVSTKKQYGAIKKKETPIIEKEHKKKPINVD